MTTESITVEPESAKKESFWNRLWKKKPESTGNSKVTEEPAPKAPAEPIYSSPLTIFVKLGDKSVDIDYFRELGIDFNRFGFNDGIRGFHCEQIKTIARTEIVNTRNYIEKHYRGQKDALESRLEIKASIKENAEYDYDSKNRYYEKLTKSYQFNPRNFSLILALIYGIFSLVLIAADIPLALELTQKGFDLQTNTMVNILDLFRSPWTVFQAYWETFLLSGGIAFCTIYIKIYYDEFVGSPIETLVRKASEMPEIEIVRQKKSSAGADDQRRPETIKEYEIDEQLATKFRRFYSARFIFKTFFLIFLFTTIVILGFFRYNVNTEARGGNFYVVLFTFIALTIVFPTISGICASLSLNCWQNHREYNNAEQKRDEAKNTLHSAFDEYNRTKSELEPLSKTLKWLEQDAIEEYQKYFEACYEHGYERGLIDPQRVIHEDLYTMTETFRQRHFVREMSGRYLVSKAVEIAELPTNGDHLNN